MKLKSAHFGDKKIIAAHFMGRNISIDEIFNVFAISKSEMGIGEATKGSLAYSAGTSIETGFGLGHDVTGSTVESTYTSADDGMALGHDVTGSTVENAYASVDDGISLGHDVTGDGVETVWTDSSSGMAFGHDVVGMNVEDTRAAVDTGIGMAQTISAVKTSITRGWVASGTGIEDAICSVDTPTTNTRTLNGIGLGNATAGKECPIPMSGKIHSGGVFGHYAKGSVTNIALGKSSTGAVLGYPGEGGGTEPEIVTKIVISYMPSNDRFIYLSFCQSSNRAVKVYWGDGTSSVGEAYGTTVCHLSHYYSTSSATITITVAPGETWYPALYNLTSTYKLPFVCSNYAQATIARVSFGNRVTKIASCAFRKWVNGSRSHGVSSVELSSSISEIDDYGFCSGPNDNSYFAPLQSIKFAEGLTKIGAWAFGHSYNRSTLCNFILPSTLISIGEHAFDSANIGNLYIPASATIDDTAFSGARIYGTLTVQEGHPVYHSSGNCLIHTATRTITKGSIIGAIPEDGSVTKIGVGAFSYFVRNDDSWSITIPGNIVEIGSRAFASSYGLSSVTIADGVTSIGDAAFTQCKAIRSISLPNTVTSIGSYVFSLCDNLTSVSLSTGVTNLPDQAFYSCKKLTQISIPDGVRSIGKSTFNSAGLTSITLPSSITSIGDSAFSYCKSLTSFVCKAVTPPQLSNFALTETPAGLTIYVPATSIEDYKAAPGWSAVASQIQAIPEE